MKIVVSKEDIEKGRKQDGSRCPIAIATRRATGLKGITVGIGEIKREVKGKKVIFHYLNKKARNFVVDFDDTWGDGGGRKLVKPFSFNIPVSHLIKVGYRKAK
jgi:hypothetical protein